MSHTTLNDLVYSFEPLEIFTPDPNYKVDETALEKSKKKNRDLIAYARDYLGKMETKEENRT